MSVWQLCGTYSNNQHTKKDQETETEPPEGPREFLRDENTDTEDKKKKKHQLENRIFCRDCFYNFCLPISTSIIFRLFLQVSFRLFLHHFPSDWLFLKLLSDSFYISFRLFLPSLSECLYIRLFQTFYTTSHCFYTSFFQIFSTSFDNFYINFCLPGSTSVLFRLLYNICLTVSTSFFQTVPTTSVWLFLHQFLLDFFNNFRLFPHQISSDWLFQQLLTVLCLTVFYISLFQKISTTSYWIFYTSVYVKQDPQLLFDCLQLLPDCF